MITEQNPKFNIESIVDSLPINYRLINGVDIHDAAFSRNASFGIYNSGISPCFEFYKPISRLLIDKDETSI